MISKNKNIILLTDLLHRKKLKVADIQKYFKLHNIELCKKQIYRYLDLISEYLILHKNGWFYTLNKSILDTNYININKKVANVSENEIYKQKYIKIKHILNELEININDYL